MNRINRAFIGTAGLAIAATMVVTQVSGTLATTYETPPTEYETTNPIYTYPSSGYETANPLYTIPSTGSAPSSIVV